MVEQDHEIMKHLRCIHLDDNLDENGSYKITFTFNDEAKEFMEPLVIYKHVQFLEEKPDDQFSGEKPPKEIIDVTKIKWKPGKSPIEAAAKLREEQQYGKSNVDASWSFFEWFDEKPWEHTLDIGEIFRREIWHSPLSYLLDQNHSDDDDDELDESFDDEDDDEGNVNDEDDDEE